MGCVIKQPGRSGVTDTAEDRQSIFYRISKCQLNILMHFEQAQIDILNWLTTFVEKPNDRLDGWSPCPYARRARLNGEFEIRPGKIDPYTDLQTADLGDKFVIAYVYNPLKFLAEEFNQQIQSVNRAFLLPRNIIALADHPGSKEEVKGVLMNQGDWADPPIGDPPTDEEYDLFLEFLEDYNYDRYDDWWTDRKGGYDVTFELNNDDTEEGNDFDSDEETLH